MIALQTEKFQQSDWSVVPPISPLHRQRLGGRNSIAIRSSTIYPINGDSSISSGQSKTKYVNSEPLLFLPQNATFQTSEKIQIIEMLFINTAISSWSSIGNTSWLYHIGYYLADLVNKKTDNTNRYVVPLCCKDIEWMVLCEVTECLEPFKLISRKKACQRNPCGIKMWNTKLPLSLRILMLILFIVSNQLSIQ